jgi:hypothetical protein
MACGYARLATSAISFCFCRGASRGAARKASIAQGFAGMGKSERLLERVRIVGRSWAQYAEERSSVPRPAGHANTEVLNRAKFALLAIETKGLKNSWIHLSYGHTI